MLEEGPLMNLTPNRFKATLKKIGNWKTLRLDGIHGFWFEKFTPIQDRLATEMNECIQKTEITEWMIKGTTLIQKYPVKGTAPTIYRHITCLPILAAQIRETFIDKTQNLPRRLKAYCKKTKDIEELLYIDQHILNEGKTRQKNLAMAWIDNKKLTIWSPKGG